MLSEFATAPDPQRTDSGQRDWYEEIPTRRRRAARCEGLVIGTSVPGERCDLTVDSGPALAGYRSAGRADYFNQPVPGR